MAFDCLKLSFSSNSLKQTEQSEPSTASSSHSGYLQDLVYNLSKVGKVIENNDLQLQVWFWGTAVIPNGLKPLTWLSQRGRLSSTWLISGFHTPSSVKKLNPSQGGQNCEHMHLLFASIW
ncbi:hypothetical protein Rs2_14443 [Raphanus sativus]|nr:hypothetical protein Rs2_14443 [Raphanus sativus]